MVSWESTMRRRTLERKQEDFRCYAQVAEAADELRFVEHVRGDLHAAHAVHRLEVPQQLALRRRHRRRWRLAPMRREGPHLIAWQRGLNTPAGRGGGLGVGKGRERTRSGFGRSAGAEHQSCWGLGLLRRARDGRAAHSIWEQQALICHGCVPRRPRARRQYLPPPLCWAHRRPLHTASCSQMSPCSEQQAGKLSCMAATARLRHRCPA